MSIRMVSQKSSTTGLLKNLDVNFFQKYNEGGNCPEKYHLVVSDDDYFPESDEELLDIMAKVFKRQFTGTEEARQFIAVYVDEHPEKYISLNEFVEYYL